MNKITYMAVSLSIIAVLAVVIAYDWLQGTVEPIEPRETDVPIRVVYPNVSNTAGNLTLTITKMTFTENHVLVLFHGVNTGGYQKVSITDSGMIVQDGRIFGPAMRDFPMNLEWLSNIGRGETVTGHLVFKRPDPGEMTVMVNLADEWTEHPVHLFDIPAGVFAGIDTVLAHTPQSVPLLAA